jgi:putative FmdB family regulatory protein
MPIYEYACEACGEKFEQLVRTMSGKEKVACPKCTSAKTKRALSVFAVGAEGASKTGSEPAPGMCGRCGGPGPCASGF